MIRSPPQILAYQMTQLQYKIASLGNYKPYIVKPEEPCSEALQKSPSLARKHVLSMVCLRNPKDNSVRIAVGKPVQPLETDHVAIFLVGYRIIFYSCDRYDEEDEAETTTRSVWIASQVYDGTLMGKSVNAALSFVTRGMMHSQHPSSIKECATVCGKRHSGQQELSTMADIWLKAPEHRHQSKT
jgi:hypothetical protein